MPSKAAKERDPARPAVRPAASKRVSSRPAKTAETPNAVALQATKVETGGRAMVAAPDELPDARPSVRQARAEEPVWLVRIAIVLFLVGFAAFLAREVANFLRTV